MRESFTFNLHAKIVRLVPHIIANLAMRKLSFKDACYLRSKLAVGLRFPVDVVDIGLVPFSSFPPM